MTIFVFNCSVHPLWKIVRAIKHEHQSTHIHIVWLLWEYTWRLKWERSRNRAVVVVFVASLLSMYKYMWYEYLTTSSVYWMTLRLCLICSPKNDKCDEFILISYVSIFSLATFIYFARFFIPIFSIFNCRRIYIGFKACAHFHISFIFRQLLYSFI